MAVIEHQPVGWGYTKLKGVEWPWVRCRCGWESAAGLRWWEDVGEALDEHLSACRAAAAADARRERWRGRVRSRKGGSGRLLAGNSPVLMALAAVAMLVGLPAASGRVRPAGNDVKARMLLDAVFAGDDARECQAQDWPVTPKCMGTALGAMRIVGRHWLVERVEPVPQGY